MSIFDAIRGPRVHDATPGRPVRVYVRRPKSEPGDVFIPHRPAARRPNVLEDALDRCRVRREPNAFERIVEGMIGPEQPRQPSVLEELSERAAESSFEQSEDQVYGAVDQAIDKANDPDFYKDPFSGQSYFPSEADRIETSEQLKLLLDQRPPLSGFALTMRINSILSAAKGRARAEAQAEQPSQGGGGDFFSNLFGGIANCFENLFSKVLGVFSQLLTNPLGFIGSLLGL